MLIRPATHSNGCTYHILRKKSLYASVCPGVPRQAATLSKDGIAPLNLKCEFGCALLGCHSQQMLHHILQRRT